MIRMDNVANPFIKEFLMCMLRITNKTNLIKKSRREQSTESVRVPLLGQNGNFINSTPPNSETNSVEESVLYTNSKISEDPWLGVSDKDSSDTMPVFNRVSFRLRKFKTVLRPFYACFPTLDLATFRPELKNDLIRQTLLYHLPFVSSLTIILIYTQIGNVLSLFVLIFWLFTLFTVGINTLENNLIYVPNEPATARYLIDSPSNYGFKSWEHVELKPDGPSGPKITGYLLLQPDLDVRKNSSTILFFHGNAGNIGYRLPLCRIFSKKLSCNILIIDYRGYGRSEGQPSEAGLASDAQSALDFVLGRVDLDPNKIVVFGRSLGAAVAVELVTKPSNHGRIKAMIIENTFTSMPEMAKALFARLSFPLTKVVPTWMYSNIYPTLARFELYMKEQTSKISLRASFDSYVPMLFLVGEADTLTPPIMIKRIASVYLDHVYPNSLDNLNDGLTPKEFLEQNLYSDGLVKFQDGNHNDTWLQPGWSDVIEKFFTHLNVIKPSTLMSTLD